MNQETKKQPSVFDTVFVTVGNGNFDPLIKEIDRLKAEGKLPGEVTIQIGHGKYQPKHCEFFKFAPTLQPYYEKATLVISHGGPGTVFEILRKKLPLIALANKDRTDPRHQVEFLEAISAQSNGLIYCPSVQKLKQFLNIAEEHEFIDYQKPECTIHELINDYLDKIDEKEFRYK
jgi:beta-1,4-N-acetylglucosaminyltransferase